jgi:DNA-binding MarR family transcriptional regulator
MTLLASQPASDQALHNPLESHLGYHLRRASAAMFGDLTRNLADLALKPADASALLLIGANPGITLSAVGRALGIHRANMTPIATMLHRRDLVERHRADGRSNGLTLTAPGRRLHDDLLARIALHEAPFLQRLEPAERALAMDLIRKIWRA